MALGLSFTGTSGLGGLTSKKKEKTLAEKAAAAGTKTDITEPVHQVDTAPEPIIPTTIDETTNQSFTVNPDLFKREYDKYHPPGPDPDKSYTYDPTQYTTGWDKLSGKNAFSKFSANTSGQSGGTGTSGTSGTSNLQSIASDLFGGSGGGSGGGAGYVSSYTDPETDPYLDHMNQQMVNDPVGPDVESPEYQLLSNQVTPADLQPDPGTPTEEVTWTETGDPVGPDVESPEYQLLSNQVTPADLQPDPGTPTEEVTWTETGPDTGTGDSATQYDQMFQDIMDKHGAGWQNQEDLVRAQAASQQRRSAEAAAGLGAAASGGTMASGMAQAGLKGQEMMMQARQEHELRGLELQMTNLMNKLKVAEASKDRELQEHLQYMINNTALAIENARLDAIPEIDPAELEAANAERAERGEEPMSPAEYAAMGAAIGGFVPGVGWGAGAIIGGGYGFLKHLSNRDEDTPWWKVW